jgi:cytochrome b involved in lipid metabolism
MLTSVTFYNDNIAIIVNYNVIKHVVNNKMTNLIWQNNIDNTKDLNIENGLVLEPNRYLQRCHATFKQKET